MQSSKRARSSDPSPVDDTQDAMDSLRRIVRALRVFSHTTKKNLSVSGAQLYVLQRIEDEPGLSLKALAHRTLTDASSVSVVVSRLVESGMIKRRTAGDDARRSHLEITARGRALLHKAPQAVQARMTDGLRSLPPADLARVADALRKLVVHMGADGHAPTMFFEAESGRGSRRGKRKRVRA